MPSGGQAVRIRKTDRVCTTATGSIDPHRLRRLLNADTECRDRGPRPPETLWIRRRPARTSERLTTLIETTSSPLSTIGEEPARCRVMRVRGVESADQNIGVDDDHRSASSASIVERLDDDLVGLAEASLLEHRPRKRHLVLTQS